MNPPPASLVDSLVQGPSLITAVEWHDQVGSTNARAVQAAADGAAEGLVVLADEQTAGRGRRGRSWQSPSGTSLLASLVLRESADLRPGLVPIAVGVALAEAAAGHASPATVSLSWPNDLMVAGERAGRPRKAAGILVEATGDAVVVGVGVDVDWRGVDRTAMEGLSAATSLAEAAGRDVDRWRLFAALCGLLGHRLTDAAEEPARLLDAYRERCRTLGARVHVQLPDKAALDGQAVDIAADGALIVDSGDARHQLHAADVAHLDDEPGAA